MEDLFWLLYLIGAIVSVLMIVKFFQIASDVRMLRQNQGMNSPESLILQADEEVALGDTETAKKLLQRAKFRIETLPMIKPQKRQAVLKSINIRLDRLS